MTEQPASFPSEATLESLDTLLTRVTPENVLHSGNVVRAEAMLLADKLQHARLEAVVREPGQDPVSIDAAPRFNATIDTNFTMSQAYTDFLQRVADVLAQTARSYGHTEQTIRASFAQYQRANPPPDTPDQRPGTPPRPS